MKLKLRRGKKVLMLVGCVTAIIAVVAMFFFNGGASADELITAKIERGSIRNTVSATGTLQAVTTVQVGSQVSGTISALYVDFNSVVRKDQIVAQLDPAIFEAQVAQSRANLEQARASLIDAQARVLAAESTVQTQRAGVSSASANLAALKAQRDDASSLLERQQSLAASGVIAQREIDTARTGFQAAEARYQQAAAQLDQARAGEQSASTAGLAQAQAQVRQAQAQIQQAEASLSLAEVNLSHTTIRSPIDGVVVSRSVDVGQTVAASLSAPTLFTIANDLTRMQIIANIDQADIGLIHTSNGINFTVDAYPGQNFQGTIEQIRLNPQNVQNVVTYNLVIDVKNPDLKLMPGMTADLKIIIAERDGALKVPNAALRFVPQDRAMGQRSQRPAGESANRTGQREQKAGEAKEQNGSESKTENAARPEGRSGWGVAPPTSAVLPGQSRIVWVLGADKKPEPRRIKIGITDGVATEILEGELQEGEVVITGQAVSGESRSQSNQRPSAFGGATSGSRGRR